MLKQRELKENRKTFIFERTEEICLLLKTRQSIEITIELNRLIGTDILFFLQHRISIDKIFQIYEHDRFN
jgi:hypothetical protein